MTEIDEISARLTVLETIVGQLITHMAVRADDPPGWVRTRRVLAASALNIGTDPSLRQAALIRDAIGAVFQQAEMVAREYAEKETPRVLARSSG